MADSPIGSLPLATDIYDEDLFVLEQNGAAKKLKGEKLTEYVDRNVVDVQVTYVSAAAEESASYNATTGVLTLYIRRGNGIASIAKTGTSGLVDTYTITYDNNTSTTFQVTNGSSIASIENTDTQTIDGRTVKTYTITLTNGDDSNSFQVTDGKDASGAPGTATPLVDSGNGGAGSATNFAREDHYHPAAALSFTVTLTAAGWDTSLKTQRIQNNVFQANGYSYIASPVYYSRETWSECDIDARDVTTTGSMTFHCGTIPTGPVVVNILRVVSNDGQDI